VSQKLTTGTPLTPKEALTKIRFIIGTGGDDQHRDRRHLPQKRGPVHLNASREECWRLGQRLDPGSHRF
jgi:hypothetical protein